MCLSAIIAPDNKMNYSEHANRGKWGKYLKRLMSMKTKLIGKISEEN